MLSALKLPTVAFFHQARIKFLCAGDMAPGTSTVDMVTQCSKGLERRKKVDAHSNELKRHILAMCARDKKTNWGLREREPFVANWGVEGQTCFFFWIMGLDSWWNTGLTLTGLEFNAFINAAWKLQQPTGFSTIVGALIHNVDLHFYQSIL